MTTMVSRDSLELEWLVRTFGFCYFVHPNQNITSPPPPENMSVFNFGDRIIFFSFPIQLHWSSIGPIAGSNVIGGKKCVSYCCNKQW